MENNKTVLPTVDQGGCPTPVDSSGRPYTCKERSSVLTYREQEVMQKILEVKREADTIKNRLQAMREGEGGDAETIAFWESRLHELRELRERLEQEREEAVKERMRLLGHS